MPREARKTSMSGTYHILLQGINQQLIFEDDEDCSKFLEILDGCKETSGLVLYAYCLMGSHVHLLMKTGYESLEQTFKRVGTKYVQWFNRKHGRTGPLFQDRFKGEPVEYTDSFLAAIRYIHQDPVKAQLAGSLDAYKWSSYKEYAKKRVLCDTSFAIKMMRIRERLIAFHNEPNSDSCLDMQPPRISDKAAVEIIKTLLNCDAATDIRQLDKQERKAALVSLKQKGLSIRQISRLVGIGKKIVENA